MSDLQFTHEQMAQMRGIIAEIEQNITKMVAATEILKKHLKRLAKKENENHCATRRKSKK